MARPLRIEFPGAVYHVISRGNARQPIFLNVSDRKNFLGRLHKVCTRFNWHCHAYCLMDNHYHLLIETVDGQLSRGMRELNGVYTQGFNQRHDRVGHLFQGRYKAIIVEKQVYLLELCRYIVLNPVRAGIVKEAGGWPWSSYRGTAVLDAAHPALTPDWLLLQFSDSPEEARLKYVQFVADDQGLVDPGCDVKGKLFLGNVGQAHMISDYLQEKRLQLEIPREQRFADRPELSELFVGIHDVSVSLRNILIINAVVHCGYKQCEVARHLNLHYSTISRILGSGLDP